METEWQRRERKKQKKEEMLRLCRLLDVKDWDKNEQIAQKVRSIIHKEEKVLFVKLSETKLSIYVTQKNF
ncbi:flagellar motor switch protein [Enterococcus faecium]|uniref:flagellar motor switch protein n=1 Tax=Enterococcus faecium TaxID=1352 RepID=UPI001E5264D0|nr:flagellar motor switch protein [Enterococcus faecium]MCE3183313.1 flagellar motor switch protein [Enterococcus faecium]